MKKIGKEQVRKARQTLAKYKEGKAVLDKRIVSNEQWWKLRHWGEIGCDKDDTRPMPASAWLFNSLANKHADAMDNIPEPAVLPREKSDEEVAKQLSLILPAILERCSCTATGGGTSSRTAVCVRLLYGTLTLTAVWGI